MDEESIEKQIKERLRETPPQCVGGFQCKAAKLPTPLDHNFQTAWRLAWGCGGTRGRIMGHLLKDYVPEHDGLDFISPLGFECSDCRKITEILDTDWHGYHSQVAKVEGGIGSAKIRGKGRRKQYPCAKCGAREFAVTVGFVYWHFDLFLDEGDLISEGLWKKQDFAHPEDFFNVFLSSGRCTNCRELSEFTTLGKL